MHFALMFKNICFFLVLKDIFWFDLGKLQITLFEFIVTLLFRVGAFK